MRTIMFRGKTIKDNGMLPAGSWITGGYYMDDCYGGCPQGRHYILTWNSGGPGGFMDRVEVDRESVGQFTGLKDENGKWIYEGDIVKQTFTLQRGNAYDGTDESYNGHHLGRVVITAGGVVIKFPLCYLEETDETNRSNQYKRVAGYRSEVIGNINDNPELLES